MTLELYRLSEKLKRLKPKEKRDDMTTYVNGDIVLSRESTFSSWFIRKFTSSNWSHVGLIFDTDKFVSAVPFKGVCERPLSVVTTRAIYRLRGMTPEQTKVLRDFAYSKIGYPYDMQQVFLLGWRILTNTKNKYGDDPKPDKLECLEFVGEAYDKIGIRFGKYVDNLLPNVIVNSPLLEKVE